MIELGWEEFGALCSRAILAAGGDEPTATALTAAVVAAERRGNAAVGVEHLFDYLSALAEGRLNGSPRLQIHHSRGAVFSASADHGIAQLPFQRVLPELLDAARDLGVAVLSITDAFTVGELGHYAWEVADRGLIALAGANSPALMSLYGVPTALTGTNPLAFALPATPTPRLIDQASSATAWVRIRDAALSGEPIPPDWAVDPDGLPTTDAAAALQGALLPFGGIKGSNIALIVELLSVLSGARFSIDAPAFDSGSTAPDVGMFLLALDPEAFDADYLQRVDAHLTRLQTDHGIDFGRFYRDLECAVLSDEIYARLVAAAESAPRGS